MVSTPVEGQTFIFTKSNNDVNTMTDYHVVITSVNMLYILQSNENTYPHVWDPKRNKQSDNKHSIFYLTVDLEVVVTGEYKPERKANRQRYLVIIAFGQPHPLRTDNDVENKLEDIDAVEFLLLGLTFLFFACHLI